MEDEVSTDPERDGQGEEKYRKPPREDGLRDTFQDRGLTSQHVPPCLFSTNTGVVVFSGLRKEMLGQLIENEMWALCCCPGF